ncbi:MAG TPA: GNAT family protein [Gemmatimonadaceae bacterium]|nr:GNAT family protein [Gemmatimonadaceae bacterium]
MSVDPIHTPRLVLRSWRPEDAPVLKDAIDSSLAELREWMPWAVNEPSPVGLMSDRLTTMQSKFANGEDWTYAVLSKESKRLVGGAGLHPRIGAGGLEIGYWIRTDSTGAGLATETAAALTAAAFEWPGIDRVEIRCDPRNLKSAAIPRHLGYSHTTTLKANTVTPQGAPRDTMVWTLTRAELDAGLPHVRRYGT